MATKKNLAQTWDEQRGRALRDACIQISGASAVRARLWQRHDVVGSLYALSQGKPGVMVDVADLLSATGMPEGQVFNAIDALEQEGALQAFNGGCVALLPKGAALHERRAMRPYRTLGSADDLSRLGKPGLVATVPGAAPSGSAER